MKLMETYHKPTQRAIYSKKNMLVQQKVIEKKCILTESLEMMVKEKQAIQITTMADPLRTLFKVMRKNCLLYFLGVQRESMVFNLVNKYPFLYCLRVSEPVIKGELFNGRIQRARIFHS